ncbi:MAG: nitronate monooxygenase [Ignavibacteriaceae bacterium]|jgi:NAD(P)H-dependent flavin oxidoreductase YrpB (nitropropane dioxygenase family)
MGVYISTPFLANACSRAGALGTVSCVTAERILARVLQSGDPHGHYRRALEHFPFPEIAERIIKTYFVADGIPADYKFKKLPAFSMQSRRDLIELTVAASFSFVWLAKEGHSGPISVNYLEKIQIPHIYHITGAMLAGVDFVTMGAGITLQIPGVLDAIASRGIPSYRVIVEGSKNGTETISFNPSTFFKTKFPELKRPEFLPIVSTDVLASLMAKRLPANSIQGFVVEKPTAGGHNAPPRKNGVFDETGQPVYGQKDEVSFKNLASLSIPFWVGGSLASPEGLAEAQALGAVGIQAGSIFALCDNSGMKSSYRNEMRRLGYCDKLVIRTDSKASPTGFPFKVVQLNGTQSDSTIYNERKRVCDLSALLVPYKRSDNKIGFRCSSEPINDYLRKGGKLEDAKEARCLCNGLFSAAGFGNPNELPIFTMGDDVSFLSHLMRDENDSYWAVDAIKYLLTE